MSDLVSLAERVEAGCGPDRELDAEIDAALFGGRASHLFDEGTPAARLRRSYGPGAVFDHTDPETNGGHVLMSMHRTACAYTASLDAVVALLERVLPGWDWCRLFAPHGPVNVYVRAPDRSEAIGAAPDTARALLSATLRALSEKGRE